MTKCVWIAMFGNGGRVFAQKYHFGAITDTCRRVVDQPESTANWAACSHRSATALGQDDGNTLQPVFLIKAFWRLAV
jgi:hypothetical protein